MAQEPSSGETKTTDPPAGGRRTALLARLTQPLGLVATVVGIVGGLAGIVLAIDQLTMGDSRPEKLSATIDCVDVRPLSDSANLALEHPGQTFTPEPDRMGIRATFDIRVVGREGQELPVRGLLLDEQSNPVEMPDDSRTVMPESLNDAEDRSWWTPLPEGPGRFTYRIELLRPGGVGPPLRSAETDPVVSSVGDPEWRVDPGGRCRPA